MRTRRWTKIWAVVTCFCLIVSMTGSQAAPLPARVQDALLPIPFLLCQTGPVHDPLYPTWGQRFVKEQEERVLQPKRTEPAPFDFVATCTTLGGVTGAVTGLVYPWNPTPQGDTAIGLFIGCTAVGMLAGWTLGLLLQKN